jgi:nucleoside-diphosphate-sugar epimerase
VQTVFIIGGAGFIGSHFAQCLTKIDNYRIVIIDKQDSANLDGIRHQIVFECCDVEGDKCGQLFEKYKCDIVFSFVVLNKIRQYCTNVKRYFQILSYFDDSIDADIIIRIPYCMGSRLSSNHILYKMIESAVRQENITVIGDGSIARDWIYVKNCCDAILKLLDFCDIANYLVKPDFTICDRDLARKILEKFELPFSFIEYAENKIELQTNKLNFTNVVTVTDLRVSIDIDDILSKVIGWVKEHTNTSAL